MYRITIEKIEEKNCVTDEYERLRSAYPTEQEMESIAKKKDPEFGYVKKVGTRTIEIKLLELCLEKLDIVEVTKKVLECTK